MKERVIYFYHTTIKPLWGKLLFYWLAGVAEFAAGAGLPWRKVRWLVPSSLWEWRAEKVWVREGLIYSLHRNELPGFEQMGELCKQIVAGEWYCGYVRYPSCPFVIPQPKKPDGLSFNEWMEKDVHDARFADYLPVHGGVTFERADPAGYVIGFDCNHYRDVQNPMLRNHEWLANEINNLRVAIDFMADEGYEATYLTLDRDGRAELIDSFHDELQERGLIFEFDNNFGAMINVLSGRL